MKRLVLVLAALLHSQAEAQTLTGLRFDGPPVVMEDSTALYRAIAEFDNGWEYDVTLDAYLWTEPGIYADINVFGILTTSSVPSDSVETIWAFYSFGSESQIASLDVDILDLPRAGYAFHFDGGDHVLVSHSDSLHIMSSLTIEAWARFDNPGGGWQQIVCKGDDQSGMDPYYLRVLNGQLEFGIDGDEGQSTYLYTDIMGYDWDIFHHVAAVFDDAADKMLIYIDGEPVTMQATTVRPLTDQAGMNVWVGKEHRHLQHYRGDLDEVRIWNVARSACDIRRHRHRPLRGDEAGLVGYWRFDEADEQYAYDSSPFGNDGMLGYSDDPAGEDADPQRVLSEADLSLDAFDPPYWTTPVMNTEVSSGQDWAASLSYDQLSLYIASGRDDADDINVYVADRVGIGVPFSTPVLVPELSVVGYLLDDTYPRLRANGLRCYLTRFTADGPGDLFVAQRDTSAAPWNEPSPITPLNTSASEWAMTVSSDELVTVFVSDRSGTARYWAASRDDADAPWENNQLIGSLSAFVPRSCVLSDDALTLHVIAEGPDGFGSADVWRLSRDSRAEVFGAPELLSELSSEFDELDLSLSPALDTAYLVRSGPGGTQEILESHYVDPGAPHLGDLNCDDVLDLSDHSILFSCLGGPGAESEGACTTADLDGDTDVDLHDYRLFQVALGS